MKGNIRAHIRNEIAEKKRMIPHYQGKAIQVKPKTGVVEDKK